MPKIASDYDIVLENFKMKLKVRRCPKSPRIRFDLDKLKDPEIVEVLQTKIGGKCAALNMTDHEIDTIAKYIEEEPLETVEEVLWRKRKKN